MGWFGRKREETPKPVPPREEEFPDPPPGTEVKIVDELQRFAKIWSTGRVSIPAPHELLFAARKYIEQLEQANKALEEGMHNPTVAVIRTGEITTVEINEVPITLDDANKLKDAAQRAIDALQSP